MKKKQNKIGINTYIQDALGFHNPVNVGNIGEHAAIKLFLSFDIPLFVPVTDKGIDLIAYFNNKLQKIQIKTTCSHNIDDKFILFNLANIKYKIKDGHVTSYRQKYSPDMIDYFVLYDANFDELYILKNSGVRNTICLRIDEPLNNQSKNVHYAKDYKLEDFLRYINEGINPETIIDQDENK